jgi:hypothetical protein
MRFMRLFVLLLASNIFLSQTAFSSNLTWTINNHSYEYGGYLSGSFDFDADTGAFSNIDITSHTQFDFTYTDANVDYIQYYDAANPDYLLGHTTLTLITDVPGELHDLYFFFSGDLTNDGGVLDLVSGPYGTEEAVSFTDPDYPDGFYNQGLTGTGTISAVPVPAAAWLFGSALAGLGWMRRKQTV